MGLYTEVGLYPDIGPWAYMRGITVRNLRTLQKGAVAQPVADVTLACSGTGSIN